MNITARAAREAALKRHRRQIVITAVVSSLIGAAVGGTMRAESWESGTGPAMQKLEVKAYGFVGKDGRWRSYDTGEPIEVTGWR